MELRRSYYQGQAWSPEWPASPADAQPSDIVLHLPVLEYYASLCWHVTELGTRNCFSTVAFLSGCRGEVVSLDLERSAASVRLSRMALPCRWQFHLFDTSSLSAPIGPTDLLFFDTLHSAHQVDCELRHHGRKARRFLAFHDTHTFRAVDERLPRSQAPDRHGIVWPVTDFLRRYPGEYRTVYRTDVNNGLWVLERIQKTRL